MITSSHNPPEWNGVKYKASYGGSGLPSIMTAIESYLGQPLPAAATTGQDRRGQLQSDVRHRARAVRRSRKRSANPGYRFLIDSMYGCGRGVSASHLLARRRSPSSRFAASSTRPFPASTLSRSCRTSRLRRRQWSREKCDAGLITDGDADRIGAVDEHGNVVDAHKSLRACC